MTIEEMRKAIQALRDLRAEVAEMERRVGWAGHGARKRADAILRKAESDVDLRIRTPEEQAGFMELVDKARQAYCQGSSNNIEVDDDARLSQGDEGTWVQGWLWVPNDEDEDDEDCDDDDEDCEG